MLKLINPANQILDLWLQASFWRKKEGLSLRRQTPGCPRRERTASMPLGLLGAQICARPPAGLAGQADGARTEIHEAIWVAGSAAKGTTVRRAVQVKGALLPKIRKDPESGQGGRPCGLCGPTEAPPRAAGTRASPVHGPRHESRCAGSSGVTAVWQAASEEQEKWRGRGLRACRASRPPARLTLF